MNLALRRDGPAPSAISPKLELGAYEALWLEQGATFKTLADRFARDPSALPSDFIPPGQALAAADEVLAKLKASGVHQFGVRINHAGDYPKKLRDAKYPGPEDAIVHPLAMASRRGVREDQRRNALPLARRGSRG